MKEERQGGGKNGGRDKEEGVKKENWQLCLQTLIWTVDLLGQLVESLSAYTVTPGCVWVAEWVGALLCLQSDLSGLLGGDRGRGGQLR